MAWYYSAEGRQVGPVEESVLDDLARQGVVKHDTMMWKEGMPAWQPHSAARGAVTGVKRYGGFWIRFVARIIDGIILAVVGTIVRIPLAAVMGVSAVGIGTSSDPGAAAIAALPMMMALG